VRGLVSFFPATPAGGEFQIARFSSTSPPVIELLGTGTIPTPKIISQAQLASRTLDGQLVRLLNLRVDSIGVQSATGTGSFNVVTTNAAGARVVLRIDNRATNITPAMFAVGNFYDITGVALNFLSGGTFTPQIKPRSPADVVLSGAFPGTLTIEAAKARAAGDTVTVEGVVTSGTPGLSGGGIYIQDATAGIQVFQSGGLAVAVGDYIRVRGVVSVFSGEKQIARFSSTVPVDFTILGQGALPAPRVVTGAELLSRNFEGMLVRLNDVTVTAISTPSTSTSSLGAYNVDVTAPDGSVIRVRMESPKNNVVPPTTFTVGAKYDLIGIAAAFNSVEQLKPRTTADVIAR
jgi:DNA/RNA endonuclease YhcR with UshA esterase domain